MAEQAEGAELQSPGTDMPVEMKPKAQNVPQLVMYKNRLQEYAQKSAIPLPVYQTLNEGKPHAPKFRSTVFVDGVYYTSQNTFSNRKAAEQDVAKLALDGITKKIKEEGCPLINEDTVFCKSILIEYAVKLNMEKPQYKTIQPEGPFPMFVSSLVFNGVTYTGEAARSKREAEQVAARGVIISILGTSDTRTSICEIIKSKSKLYAALHKAKDLGSTQRAGTDSGIPLIKGKSIEVTECEESVPSLAITDTCLGQNDSVSAVNPPFHEFKRPRLEPSSETSTLPISFVPPVLEQPLCSGSSSAGEWNRKKKKANQNVPADAQLPVAVMPLTHV
ncbi:hypothetical protein NMG60_11006102 [Bertholletia excelsa]